MNPRRGTALRLIFSLLILEFFEQPIYGRISSFNDEENQEVRLEESEVEAEDEEGREQQPDPENMPREGNGFEFEGLRGHHGLFQVFNWTRDELRRISEYHAAAEYHKVVDMVQDKLATTDLHPLARKMIVAFINKHKPPEPVKYLFSDEQRDEIKEHLRNRDITRILKIVQDRFDTLRPEVRKEVMDYLNINNRTN